ncbi:hypothetical protein HN51_054304 [Arachis hypogaea]
MIEQSFFPGAFSVEMSSKVYKNWVFPDQALPAVEDPSATHGVHLVIEDYPYAVDGLEIWDAIKTWVQDYVSLYYASDNEVTKDTELQKWWKEAVERGHEDLKDKPWWPKLQTLEDLVQSCSIIIWIGSALHAAVNFGQYPYGGFILNRPTISRRFLPKLESEEYQELVTNPQKAYLRTITGKLEALVDLSVIENLRYCQGMLLMRCILGRETIRTGHRIRGRYKPSRSLETSWRIWRRKSSRGTKSQALETELDQFICHALCSFLPVMKALLSEAFQTVSLSKISACVFLCSLLLF